MNIWIMKKSHPDWGIQYVYELTCTIVKWCDTVYKFGKTEMYHKTEENHTSWMNLFKLQIV